MLSCFCCKAKIPNEDFSFDELPNKDQKSIGTTSKPNNKSSLKLKNKKKTIQDNNHKQQQKSIPEQGKEQTKYRQLTLHDFWKNTKKSPLKSSSNRHNLYDSIKKKKFLKSSSFVSTKTQDEPSLVQSTDQLKAKLKQYHSSKFNSAFSENRKMSNEKSPFLKPTQESESSNKKNTSISPSPIKSDDSKGLFGSNKVANKPFTLNLNRVSEKPLFSSNLFASKFKQNHCKEPGFSEQSNQANQSAEERLYEGEDQPSDKQSASFAQQDTTISFGSSGLFKKNDSSLDSIFAKKRETSLLANKSKGVDTGSNYEQTTKNQTENETLPRRQSESPKKPSTLFDIPSNKNTSQTRSKTVKFISSPYTNVVCYSCGERGHYSPQCPINPKGDLSRYHCFRCGERGHFAQSCPDHYY